MQDEGRAGRLPQAGAIDQRSILRPRGIMRRGLRGSSATAYGPRGKSVGG
jgi:hypothetical protein